MITISPSLDRDVGLSAVTPIDSHRVRHSTGAIEVFSPSLADMAVPA